jgi:hypothetical protein
VACGFSSDINPIRTTGLQTSRSNIVLPSPYR